MYKCETCRHSAFLTYFISPWPKVSRVYLVKISRLLRRNIISRAEQYIFHSKYTMVSILHYYFKVITSVKDAIVRLELTRYLKQCLSVFVVPY